MTSFQDLDLPELRQRYAAAEIDEARLFERLQGDRARAEQRAIDASGDTYASLKNDRDRSRFVLIAHGDDHDYQEALGRFHAAQAVKLQLAAEIQIREDAIQLRDIEVREKFLQIESDASAE